MQALVDYAFDLWLCPEQKSAPDEAVPTSDDEEDSVVDPSARKRRRTSAEVHGTEPKRRSARVDVVHPQDRKRAVYASSSERRGGASARWSEVPLDR
jgi:hypothetical protein